MEALNAFVISGLPRIVFGDGTFAELPRLIGRQGRSALIVTGGKSLKQSGRLDALCTTLAQEGIDFQIACVTQEPTVALIDELVESGRHSSIDVVAAVGGGSVIDCGKAVSALITEQGSVRDFLEDVGHKKPSGSKVPFLAVPTTAGTGSEATKNAVICDRTEGFKKSLRHDAYVPDVAVVDPELTLSTPYAVTVACGLDAVCQLIEAYTSVKANAFTDSLSQTALPLAAQSLPALFPDNANDISLRRKMSYAALISGITLSHAGLGAVHGLAGPLGGLCPAPHGLICGKLLYPVMKVVVQKIFTENHKAGRRRFAEVGKILSGDPCDDDTLCCQRFVDVLCRWSHDFSLPQLSAFGLQPADLDKAARLADSKNSPVQLSYDDRMDILEQVI